MDNQSTTANLQSKKSHNPLFQRLRLLGGAILGYIFGFFLLVLNEAGYLPLIGLVISGQEEFLELVFFYALYDKLRSTDFTYGAALFVYASLWALIGALLLSGRRKAIRIGVISLLLYIIGGCLAYSILVMIMTPT